MHGPAVRHIVETRTIKALYTATVLAEQYRRQTAWRSWDTVLDVLPPLAGQTVVDLGCAVGDQAALLTTRGARVLGYDGNDVLLAFAHAQNILGAQFRTADLRNFTGPGEPFDGLWCSFTAAYFPDLASALERWTAELRPGGWVALTEVDDLFGHAPVAARTRELLDAYAEDSFAAGRYDFRMGRRLTEEVRKAGLAVTRAFETPDRELSFDGPVLPEVLEAWRARFDRMHLLKDFCEADFADVRDDFLDCLQRGDHRSTATVRVCIAKK